MVRQILLRPGLAAQCHAQRPPLPAAGNLARRPRPKPPDAPHRSHPPHRRQDNGIAQDPRLLRNTADEAVKALALSKPDVIPETPKPSSGTQGPLARTSP